MKVQALMLITGMLFMPALTTAQSHISLVKNWNTTLDRRLDRPGGVQTFGQEFTTGTNPGGYMLSELAIRVLTGGLNRPTTAQICPQGEPPQWDGGNTGCTSRYLVYTSAGAVRWHNWTDYFLEPETTYVAIIDQSQRGEAHGTNDDGETAQPGWSIANQVMAWQNRMWIANGSASVAMEVFGRINHRATGAPDVSGNPTAGATVRATTGTIADQNGLTDTDYTLTWTYPDGTVRGTGPELVLEERDIGRQLVVNATFLDNIKAPEQRSTSPWPNDGTIVASTTAARLSTLSLSHGTLNPAFVASETGYSARVASGISQVTVTATASASDSTLEYLTGEDGTLQDADAGTTGFQVNVATGDTVFQIRVTTAITGLTKTYRVTLQRNRATCGTPISGELWCAELSVGSKGSLRGYSENLGFGSLSPATFTHRGLTGRVSYLDYQGTTLNFQTRVPRDDTPRHGFYGNEDYVLEIGSGTAKKSFTINSPGESASFSFNNHGLTWFKGQRVLVRLKNAAARAAAPYITAAPELGTMGGADGGDIWTPGSRVTIDLTFSASVEVSTGSGRRIPSIGIELGGRSANARNATYVEGRRTNVLRFWYTITDRDGTQTSIKVVPDSLATNGGAIIANESPYVDALLGHEGAFKHADASGGQEAVDPPRIEQSPELSESGDNGTWSEGQTASVTLTFTEPVDVDTSNGTPTVGIQLGGTETRAAAYAAGSGTAALTFTYTLLGSDGAHTSMAVAPDSLALNGGTIRSVETDADAELGHEGMLALGRTTRNAPPDVRFRNVPAEHDGQTAFKLSIVFGGEPDGLSAKQDAAAVLEVDGGRVTTAQETASGASAEWEVSIAPAGRSDISVTVPARACSETNAVCIDEQPMQRDVETTIGGPPATSITATWSNIPDEHDGASAFDTHLDFSEAPTKFSYRALAGAIVSVENGRISRVWRRVKGRNNQWGVQVTPESSGLVRLRVNATTDCSAQHAACTAEGGMLEGGAEAVVSGPALLSVADAHVDENEGATLDFVVTLSRERNETTSVEYTTADGSARAGEDYARATGTLTFGPNETSKTVPVTVLDDAHDESEETVTLRLSNPAGAAIGDGEAIGTIANRDPLPRALLARFGRTAAVHVVERVEERIQAPRRRGFHGRFADRELQRGMERDLANNLVSQLGALADPTGSPNGNHGGSGHPRLLMMAGPADTRGAAANPVRAPGLDPGASNWDNSLLGMGIGREDLLTSSSFTVDRESRGGILALWNSGARSQFSSREGPLGLNGDVRTTMVGADYTKDAMITGLSVAHSRGLGEYSGPAAGDVRSSVTGLYPWVGYRATDRFTVWGVGGYGSGSLLLTPENGSSLESKMSMKMASAGTRGKLVANTTSGFELAFKADALWVKTASDEVDGPAGRLAATEAAVQRVRTAVETLRTYTAGQVSLRPSIEVGMRHDSGDAETGAGIDIGAGLLLIDGSRGLSVDVRVRTLIVHQSAGYSERGVAVAVNYTPTPSTPLGLTASVTPAWGGQAQSGANALWGRETMGGIGQQSFGADGSRIAGDISYGLAVGSRFVGRPRVGVLASEHGRDYQIGYEFGMRNTVRTRFEVGIEGRRRQNTTGSSNGALAHATFQW